MTNQGIYSSRKLPNVRNPNIKIPIANLVGGAALLALAAFSIFLNFKYIIGTLNFYREVFADGWSSMLFQPEFWTSSYEPVRLLSLAFSLFVFITMLAYISVAVLNFSRKRIWDGFRQLFQNDVPAGVPGNFPLDVSLFRQIEERFIKMEDDDEISERIFFGPNIRFLSPVAHGFKEKIRDIVLRPFRIIGQIIFWPIVIIAGLYLAKTRLPEQVELSFYAEGLIAAIPFGDAAIDVALPFLVFAAVAGAAVIGEVIFLRLLIPAGAPATDAASKGERMFAPTAPLILAEELRDKLEELAWNGFPNRPHKNTDVEISSAVLQDAGEFRFKEIMEQQPEPIDNPNHRGAIFRMVCGWLLIAVGLLIGFFLLPGAHREALSSGSLPSLGKLLAPIGTIVLTLTIAYAWRKGKKMIEQSEALLNSIWFRSPALMIELTGSIRRSEVKAGAARDDSFETSVAVDQVDLRAKMTATELISEMPVLSRADQRQLIAMRRTDDAERWLEHGMTSLQELCDHKVSMPTPDFQAKGVQDIVQGNISMEAARHKEVKRAKLQAEAEYLEHHALTRKDKPKEVEDRAEATGS